MHRLLKRQLQRHLSTDFVPGGEWELFFEVISNYYHEVEQEKTLLENALAVNSEELTGANEQLRAHAEQEHALLRGVMNSIPDLIFFKTPEGVYLGCNRAFEQYMGSPESAIIGKMDADFVDAATAAAFHKIDLAMLAQGQPHVNEEWVTFPDGAKVCVEMLRTPYFSAEGKLLGMIGIGRDITARKQSEELIWRQANFDLLTSLPNRYMFRDRLEQEIKKERRAKLSLALLLIDLDHFKEINDTLGHQIGDELLVEAARRIKTCTRASDTVARLGGDEFTVILTHLPHSKYVEAIAQEILTRLAEPFKLGEELAYVSASIGITLYPNDANNVEQLLKNADQAMYVAKKMGRNRYSYFTFALQEAAQGRLRLINDLRGALGANQFRLYFQPILELASGRIHKAEALLRWQHPERGMVGPAEFIPLAEETGLIIEIGDWVFREAARWVRRWKDLSPPGFQVSVNMSPVQFKAEGSVHQQGWLNYLHRLGLSGSSMVIEITEGLLLNVDSQAAGKLLKFRDAGIQVAIDDFGTGYSSLAYLKKFDIDYLKIDQSFVRNLASDSNDKALCEAIIVMAHKLGLKVIAEGVETEEQRNLLSLAGCDYAQGNLFSKPIPRDEFETLLKCGFQKSLQKIAS
jgi:diguanylate cyclase (GGDEF)-like protein/PAS domain S-box-containing protein